MAFPIADRIQFRHYGSSDKERFLALMTDSEVMKHVGDGPMTEREAEELWRKLMFEFYPSGKDTVWVLEATKDQRYLGHASIRPRPEYPDEWEIGYILEKMEWGRGLATEAARALVRFGFEELGLEFVFATVDDDNDRSIKVLLKAGLRFHRYEFDEQGRYSLYAVGNSGRAE